jgi:hypothetical protein
MNLVLLYRLHDTCEEPVAYIPAERVCRVSFPSPTCFVSKVLQTRH